MIPLRRSNLRGILGRFSILVTLGLLCGLAVLWALIDRERHTFAEMQRVSRESVSRAVYDTIESNTVTASSQLADTIANPLYYMDLDAIRSAIQPRVETANTKYVIVFDGAGRVIQDGTYEIPQFGMQQTDPLAKRIVDSRVPLTLIEGEVMDVSAPIMIGENKIGGIRIGVDLRKVREDQDAAMGKLQRAMSGISRNQYIVYALATIVFVLSSLSMLLYVMRRVVTPLSHLVDATERYEGGNYIQIEEQDDNTEIGQLTRSFNRMGRNLERYDSEIRDMAFTDTLTGLPNRPALMDHLGTAMIPDPERGTRALALLFFDVDNFKRINDTHGHLVGDLVLCAFAARVKKVMREAGLDHAFVARYGGDEFVVLLQTHHVVGSPELGPDESRLLQQEISAVAERIILGFKEPVNAGVETLVLQTSIGIALYPDGDLSRDELLQRADAALYMAKEAGRDAYRFYDDEHQQEIQRIQQIELDLDGAWHRGEIDTVYQPIVSLRTNAVVGVEALLRWNHPEEGHIDPELFIGVAERSGLIDMLGERMIDRACADVVDMKRALPDDYPLMLSVNISPHQLRDGILPNIIENALQSSGLPAEALAVELTETAILTYAEVVERQLARLHEQGIEVWLDDFGIGYSGLSHLRRIRVQGVKIDRTFVSDIQFDEDDRKLASAILSMARSLDIQVIAEGIESPEQKSWLEEQGCELGQGFLLGMPMTRLQCIQHIQKVHAELERLKPAQLL